jgi:hypothetical protein
MEVYILYRDFSLGLHKDRCTDLCYEANGNVYETNNELFLIISNFSF